MTKLTPLDTAHAAMNAAPDNDNARLRFYERLAEVELFLLLASEVAGDQAKPELFDIADATFVLAFDREDRLTSFTERAAPFASMSGRALVDLLAEQALGLAVNLEVAPSSFMLPPDGVAWLAQTLDHAPQEVEQGVSRIFAPSGLPEELLIGLDSKLATTTGLAFAAYLVGVEYESGAQGHMLGVVDPVPGAEEALARAVSEVLQFSGLEAAALDVAFFAANDEVTALMAKEGLRFDLPQPETPEPQAPPGSNPDKPPILR